MRHRLLYLDRILTERLIVSPHSTWWQWIRRLAHLGDGQNVFLVLGLVYLIGWLWADPYLQWADVAIGTVILLAMSVVTALKFVVRRQRPRPPGEFVAFRYDTYSFPSGHSGRMAALAVATLFFYPWLGVGLSLLALGVAACRVGVGVHYVSDIVVGFMVGTLVAGSSVSLLFYLL